MSDGHDVLYVAAASYDSVDDALADQVAANIKAANRMVSMATDMAAASLLAKPSSGLEPLTPSLPWKCSTN